MFVTIFVFYVVKSLVSGVFVQIYVRVYVFVIRIEENSKDSSLEKGKSKYKEIFDFSYQNGLEYLVYPVTTTRPRQVFCDFSIDPNIPNQTGEEVYIEKKGEPNRLKNVKRPTPQVNCVGYFNIEQPAVMSKGIKTNKTIIWNIPPTMQNHHKTKKPQMYEYEDATIFGQAEAVCNINRDFNKTRKSDFVVSDEKIKTSKRFQDQICSSVLRRRQNVKPTKTMDVHPASSRERYQNQLHTTPYYTENIINFQHKSTKMSGHNLSKHQIYKTPQVKHFNNYGDTDPANTTTGKVVEIQYTCSSKASKNKSAMRATRSNLKAALSFLKSRQKVVKSPDLSASKEEKSSPKKQQPAVKPRKAFNSIISVESEPRHKTARLHKPSVTVLHNIAKTDPFKLAKREPKKSIKARHGRIKNKLVPSKEEEFDLNLTPATSRQTTNFINVAVNNRTNKVFIAPSPIINQNAHPTAKISVHSSEESCLSLFSYYSSSKVVGFNNTWSGKFETYTNTTSDSCGKIIDSSTSYLSEATNKHTNTKENGLIRLAKRIVKKLKFLDISTSVTDSGIKIVTDKTGQRQLIVDLGGMEKSDQLNRNKLDKPLLDLDKPDLVQPIQLTVGMLWAGHEVYKNMHLEDIKSDSLPQTESIKSISVASSQLNYENQTSKSNTWAACKNCKNVYLKDVKQSSVSLLYTKNTKPMEIIWAASKNSKNMYFEDVKSESLQTFNDKNQTVREGFWARMKNRKKLKIQHIKPISINEPDQKILRNETKTRECKSKKCKKPTHFLYQSALRPIFSSNTLLKM